MATIRDTSAAAAVGTAMAALVLEKLSFGGLAYWGLIGQAMGDRWVLGQAILSVVYGLSMVTVHIIMLSSLLIMIQRQDAFTTSFLPLYAAVCSQLIAGFSLSRLWFGVLCAISTFVLFDDSGTASTGSRMKLRVGRLLTLVAASSFIALAVLSWQRPFRIPNLSGTGLAPLDSAVVEPPIQHYGPLQYTNDRVHPVDQLVRGAEASWMSTLQHQSHTLEAAVTEYKLRYDISPPPNFDKWYQFAKQKGVTLIDEYDTIYHSLLPFWALPPATLRARVREALGFGGNNLMALLIRDGFIYNHTAFSDVCNSPSFAASHGFFDRPNAFNVIHELFPIFSQSKMSSFQDILYPSPWYWYGKVSYSSNQDMDWKAKISSLWWRGSTTGGFSRDGGWRRQHRQQMIGKLNAPDTAHVLMDTKRNPEGVPEWQVKGVPRLDYKALIDVHFSHVGQCDPGDCDAQREFFDIAPPVDQQDAWKYRYLLDIDGNAFSGRFYAFLKSRSLTFKMAVFREWHEEWIKPWVHYIPLSLRGEEALETVRYLSAEAEGKLQAVRMAEASTEWAGKVLRNEDFEVWFFRLLLEYGRAVDDNRESIGYAGS
ncbi:hypothetical protein LTR48_002966 [Friedmanniomyces endolithicus]|nr:hypothetical protein LTR48_002966 [Friedmanniomyces endolithicus]